MATALAGPNRMPGRGGFAVRLTLAVLSILGICLAGVAWAFASAPGGSPDDDYHLTSTWCPPPIQDSGCPWTDVEQPTRVEVPDPIGRAASCYRFHPDISAGCILDWKSENTVLTSRYDSGDYPGGFYRFAHRLVTDDINASIVTMRVVNVLLGIAGVVAVVALARPVLRRNIVLAAGLAWVPMGSYLMASNNPSSWAISGVFIYAAAILAAADARDWRRWGLIAVAAYGALLACTARADAGIFLIVVSLAAWLLTPVTRRQLPVLAATLLAAIAGWLTFTSTGQQDVLSVRNAEQSLGFNQLLFNNIVELPDYLSGFYGLHWGPGWFDVRLYSLTTIPMIMLAGAVLMRGVSGIFARKALAMSVVGGAMMVIPVYLMVKQGLPLLSNQPRYLLPLLAVFLLLGLTGRNGRTLLISRAQTVLGVLIVCLAHSAALHATIRRYVTGQDVVGFGLDFDTEWWWTFGPQPMQVWLFGSVAFAIAAAALAWLTYRRIPLVDRSSL